MTPDDMELRPLLDAHGVAAMKGCIKKPITSREGGIYGSVMGAEVDIPARIGHTDN
jgi:hypothetical protein